MKFITIILLIMSFFLNVKAEVVNNVKINNNDRISKNTILTYGKIETGKKYSPDDLNNILKDLYETNFFKEVSLKITNNTLVINVVENKLIQTININGIKSSRIKEAILKSLNIRDKSPFIKSQVEKDLLKIKTSLSVEGFYFAKVTSSIDENLNNTVNLNFNIDYF